MDAGRGMMMIMMMMMMKILFLSLTGVIFAYAGLQCDFESTCLWNSSEPLNVVSGEDIQNLYKNTSLVISGPKMDFHNSTQNRFLYVQGDTKQKTASFFNLTSRWFKESSGLCSLEFWLHTFQSSPNTVQVLVNTINLTWHVKDDFHLKNMKWERHNITIGKITQPFRIVIEINKVTSKEPSHVAMDDIQLDNCYPEDKSRETCSPLDFKCNDQRCIENKYICNFHRDCPEGEDELQDCDKMPPISRCNFEEKEMCGWKTDDNTKLQWLRLQGRSAPFGPSTDHTFGNESGHYLFMKVADPIHKAKLNSSVFNGTPIYHRLTDSPYHNICQIRFHYYMNGNAVGHLNVYAIEHKRRGENIVQLWSKTRSEGNNWKYAAVALPPIANKFHIMFEGARAFMKRIHLALDDISLSPECFGLGFKSPPNYTEPPVTIDPTDEPSGETYMHFPKFEFSSCETTGSSGPTNSKCQNAYKMTNTRVTVMETGNFQGMQKWVVNSTNFYSVIARGASGGKLFSNGTSRGATVRGIFQWNAGDEILILVGQEGCSLGNCSDSKVFGSSRSKLLSILNGGGEGGVGGGGGGGGGGATYIFKMDKSSQPVPLLIAAGGGGLGRFNRSNSSNPDGRSFTDSVLPHNGYGHPVAGPGPGGGWNDSKEWVNGGQPLLKGAKGGNRCPNVSSAGMGGFGGGGGGCRGGGGGGGYAGGNAASSDNEYSHGQGGVSFVSGEHPHWEVSSQSGAGTVSIYPAIRNCGCEDLCIVLDPTSGDFICKCVGERVLRKDGKTCQEPLVGLLSHHIIIIVLCTLVILGSVAGAMFFLYHRYRRQKRRAERQELYGNAELQLNRLREQRDGMVTEYNPNYEFGGSTCTLQDLKEVPRENLTLVKALGQGAFGEVYQGYLSNVSGWHRDIPVAVKTLPELATNQSEMDFLMEAMIMSKFNHPNIVHFIGVCFEKPPKFLVLELLPGGDLKSFLRESRPKPDRPSPLTMSDLLMLAMDVAKGCQYLEENHFIHRDIAARNCLLSSKGPGRVVKIADFGMARDIYRSDYYRKGGKAMLPVKWMPPEAFLDGIFTSKTDVWSFGVLLWEVMSLGYMPYPGRGNQDVMQLVTSGGRLESPSNCPSPVYHIMTQCWHAVPDERPNFQTIIERLGYCMQDPDVIHASLPIFHRPPSTERDATVMRPPDSENTCLQVQRPGTEPVSPASTEYLIPIPSSNYSLSTERTELQSGSSGESIDKLLELDEKNGPTANATAAAAAPVAGSKQWETSFAKPTDNSPCAPKKRAGGYTSVPTQEEAAPQPNAVGRSPPPSIARQRPSAKKPIQSLMALQEGGATSASPSRSSISLDAAALARQHPQPYPYMNVDVSPTPIRSDKTQDNATYIIGNHYDKEINC